MSTAKFLLYKKQRRQYILDIKKGGYTPKSGLLICRHIEKLVKNKLVCDIGTGETGIIAIHAAISGAKHVTAIDIDRKTIQWARKNGEENKIKNITWKKGDLLKKTKERFDLIISNPPQMPMENGLLHDWGGRNGREAIEKIIRSGKDHLRPNGKMILLLFDFLGVTKKYNQRDKAIVQICKENGFKVDILSKTTRKINPHSKTAASISMIKKMFPVYKFKKKGGHLTHIVYILKLQQLIALSQEFKRKRNTVSP
jgi:methylase of polypeptide subunit release factors